MSYEVVLEGGKKLYWKEVLPLNKRIKYRDGKYLKTDRGFLTKLADSINSQRYPAFFRMSQDKDGHSDRADNAVGVIVGARVTNEGLDVEIEPRTDRGAKLLELFPEYPVSAFYAEDYVDKGTGKKHGPRLFHVAAVERPYINGMSAAELVAAAEELGPGIRIVDLTGGQWAALEETGEEKQLTEQGAVSYRSKEGKALIDARARELTATMPGYTEDQVRALAVDQLEEAGSIKTTEDASGGPKYSGEALQRELAEQRHGGDRASYDSAKAEAEKLVKESGGKLSFKEALRAVMNRKVLRGEVEI